ncbi:hypothetical protein Zm00014a_025876 [Zea mays]|uniref:Uncharacterized protein n=1 Tax=Zea mays TaxID=4577 RepID=A0A3L6DEY3_MAIZE|nr:hypothetical protein Zm00014a_025876 [Zea mays]
MGRRGCSCAEPEGRRKSGVGRGEELMQPFIEQSYAHVRLHQKVALGGHFWRLPLRIGPWPLHEISSLMYTL